jgi:hypothetical protein
MASIQQCTTTLQSWNVSMDIRKLSCTLDWSWMWSSSFLAACSFDLNPFNVLSWRYLKAKVHASRIGVREELWCRIQQFSSEIKNTSWIFECLWVAILLRAELCVCKHRSHFEHLLYESKINEKFWEELMAYSPWYDMDRIENDVSNNTFIVARVFVTAAKFLPSRCLATIGGFLPNQAFA